MPQRLKHPHKIIYIEKLKKDRLHCQREMETLLRRYVHEGRRKGRRSSRKRAGVISK
jgi:hypothetical protein